MARSTARPDRRHAKIAVQRRTRCLADLRHGTSAGRSRSSRRSPAVVDATERVVRSTRRTPNRSSRLRTISLTRAVEAQLLRRLGEAATKAFISAKLGPCIAPHFS
jgi:hypothetical protein